MKNKWMVLSLIWTFAQPGFGEPLSRVVTAVPTFPVPNMTPPVGYKKPEVTRVFSGAEKWMKTLQDRIFANWEPCALPPNKALSVMFSINSDGSFTNVKLRYSTGAPQEDFAGAEAVEESSKFISHVPDELSSPCVVMMPLEISKKKKTHNCVEEYLKLHPNAANDGVIWHLIPLDALQCSEGLSDSLVCIFRSKSATDSTNPRPPNPLIPGHLSRG